MAISVARRRDGWFNARIGGARGGASARSRRSAVALGALVFVLPLLFLLVTAFKPDRRSCTMAGILPQHPTLGNFHEVLGNPEEIPILRWFGNSVFIFLRPASWW